MKRYFGIADSKRGTFGDIVHLIKNGTELVAYAMITAIGVQGARNFFTKDGGNVASAIAAFYAKYTKPCDIILLIVAFSFALALVARLLEAIYVLADYASGNEVFEDIK